MISLRLGSSDHSGAPTGFVPEARAHFYYFVGGLAS